MIRQLVIAAALLTAMADAAAADAVRMGEDLYLSGRDASDELQAARDVFAVGLNVTVRGEVAQDVHAAGFDVDVEAETGGNLYAAGASVAQRAAVGQDSSLTGFTVETTPSATTAGNVRLSGASVTIAGAVEGALSAAGGEVTLNAPVGGDAWLAGESVAFGPEARVSGMLRIAAPEPVDVPEAVAPAERVTFRRTGGFEAIPEPPRDWGGMGREIGPPGWVVAASAGAITVGFLAILGAIFLAYMPDRTERLRAEIADRPGRALLAGLLGLSTLFGLVPVAALTIVGLPFIPIVLLVIVAVWVLGYLLAVYAVSVGLLSRMAAPRDMGLGLRIGALAGGVLIAALLNFIPVLGWMANFALLLFGIGGIAILSAEASLRRRDRPAGDPVPQA